MFFKKRMEGKKQVKILDDKIIKDPGWATRVSLRYQDLVAVDTRHPSPFRQLDMLKQAIRDVSSKMKEESRRGNGGPL